MKNSVIKFLVLLTISASLHAVLFFDDIATEVKKVGKTIEKESKKAVKAVKKEGGKAIKAVKKEAKKVKADVEKGVSTVEDAVSKVLAKTKPNPNYQFYAPSMVPKQSNKALNVLAWNVYLRPRATFKNGQSIRVDSNFIPRAIGKGYDVIVFSEVFDESARKILIQKMKNLGYKYHTGVVGTRGEGVEDGGVMIMSRYPIAQAKEMLFGQTCAGTDCQAEKGVMYAKIDDRGRYYHIFGTHTQAWPEGENAAIRKKQFDMIQKFIQAQKIPHNEAVIIAGDLNVNKLKYPDQYADMLKRLHAGALKFVGHPYTYDAQGNALADKNSPSEYLDYILYSTDHLVPYSGYNKVLPVQASLLWKEFPHEPFNKDLSDHYPVYGYLVYK